MRLISNRLEDQARTILHVRKCCSQHNGREHRLKVAAKTRRRQGATGSVLRSSHSTVNYCMAYYCGLRAYITWTALSVSSYTLIFSLFFDSPAKLACDVVWEVFRYAVIYCLNTVCQAVQSILRKWKTMITMNSFPKVGKSLHWSRNVILWDLEVHDTWHKIPLFDLHLYKPVSFTSMFFGSWLLTSCLWCHLQCYTHLWSFIKRLHRTAVVSFLLLVQTASRQWHMQ